MVLKFSIVAIVVYTGVVLLDSEKRIYLIKEDDVNDISQDRWNLPGGRVEVGESIITAAQREAVEETGYLNRVRSLVGVYKAKKKDVEWLYIVFDSKIISIEGGKIIDKAVKEGKWFTEKEFKALDRSELVHPDMWKVYEIAIEGKGLSLETVKFISY